MKNSLIIFLLLIGLKTFAYNSTIVSGDTDAQAKQKLITLFDEGGTLTVEEGTWTISLTNTEATIKKDVTIIGANINEGVIKHGAFDGASNKTKLIFTGSRFSVAAGCKTLKIHNLQWNKTGISTAAKHQPAVDFSNVIFDITNSKTNYTDKQILRISDGCSGAITNCSFLGFRAGAIVINRTLTENEAPVTVRGKLIVDLCWFEPAADSRNGQGAITHDSGNDEYPIPFDHSGTEYKNSTFIDCRIGTSKARNLKILNNTFISEFAGKDMIHLEEFTNNVLVKGNTFKLTGVDVDGLITVGAQQSSYNIDIIDNVVEQNGQLGKFVTGAGNVDILIEGNTIQNPSGDKEYIGFWSCNNINIQVKPGQSGLAPANISIDETVCNEVIEEGTFIIKWGSNFYLTSTGNDLKFVSMTEAPTSDEFMWEVKKHQYMGRNNYFSFKNVGNGKYLQVAKGPTGAEQNTSTYNKPYIYFGKPMIATTLLDFTEDDRVPGFGIFKENGNYALLAGSNERRSQIIKDGDDVVLYVVESEKTSTYEWSLIPINKDTGLDTETIKKQSPDIYLNTSSKTLEIINGINQEWHIYDIRGISYLNGKSSIINVNQLNSGIYIIKFDNGEAQKFIIT